MIVSFEMKVVTYVVQQSSTPLAPKGLEGLAVAETAIGDVRGREGFYHYRQYSAVELAARRSFEDVATLVLSGTLPDSGVTRSWGGGRSVPDEVARALPQIAALG